DVYQIVGVAPRGFTGTEPGVSIDVFMPTMMKSVVTRSDASWIRIYLQPRAGTADSALRDQLQGVFASFERERLGDLARLPAAARNAFLSQPLSARSSTTPEPATLQRWRPPASS